MTAAIIDIRSYLRPRLAHAWRPTVGHTAEYKCIDVSVLDIDRMGGALIEYWSPADNQNMRKWVPEKLLKRSRMNERVRAMGGLPADCEEKA